MLYLGMCLKYFHDSVFSSLNEYFYVTYSLKHQSCKDIHNRTKCHRASRKVVVVAPQCRLQF